MAAAACAASIVRTARRRRDASGCRRRRLRQGEDSIRRAVAAEAPAVSALVQRAYAPWVPVIGRRPAPMDDDYAVLISHSEVFVLEHRAGLGGILVLAPEADHLWLDNIAVEPALKGQGLGRALLDFAEAEARRLNLPEIRLLTHQRMLANIALYLRAGFVETGRRTEDGFARVYMAKRL
jgi:GNAT superfamily N-acetyltransferase